ncbi:FAD-dependent oxidoreductase [Flavobacterium johnsoniae]|uniref:FAD dependent oxidoreductase n=1 Tax=Flavobacterium johnsoniae (strain ATCC 17061 / DSM 2064 / JCM 8514 / BCRC 14874 / CCUG 350202 / NBRC 14942 / NCIMB 11054 / UW101) TaxID=376686 RepID=A5FGJ5_FLAJ1|nr:FAD-dependent oxidoreductase [Flavobacterium johnsoniae]ABQ05671.1 FAD dependent oxidoreductase [Flavobacterium johnsoniae UW101]OXG00061.1 (2Fe-2S)-binding protein [Flavobacterium johnsoniae UW101]WQG82522.1 FAD-dependent oxidoreductase [Flavobacterium johnsoniae UW101]SHL50275.1 Glycine/D-amino acid oxidase [Flavobacterium johnsoniae]
MKNADENLNDGTITSGENVSYWIDTAPNTSFEKPIRNIETEVLIIGGGIAGLTTAYNLVKAGKKVVLVEDGFIGSGESGRTTAHLTSALDDRYYFLQDTFGKDGAKLAAESHTAAISQIEKNIKDLNIDCSFKRVNGYLFLHPSDDEKNLQKEFKATQNAGLNTGILNRTPGIADGDTTPCLAFYNQAQFHILQYLDGLARAVQSLGGVIYTEARAEKISQEGALVNNYIFSAETVVVATNSPVNDLFTMHTKQAAYRTYVIAGKIPKGKLPYSLWWDTGDAASKWTAQPYHYVRVESFDDTHDLLISGGEDHKTGQSDEEGISESERYEKLEQWTRSYFPVLDEITYKWSGQVMEPVDSLGFMGRNPGDENIYIITGDSGNGMTHATIGAAIISDAILGIKNKYEDLYSPSRITVKTAYDFTKEAANMASQYLDWISSSDLKSTADLKPGEGGIISSGLKKVAVYRDYDKTLKAFSAVCPHLGCIVQWNSDEKSFDCPCHGSRFATDGTVMNGPADKNLKPITVK